MFAQSPSPGKPPYPTSRRCPPRPPASPAPAAHLSAGTGTRTAARPPAPRAAGRPWTSGTGSGSWCARPLQGGHGSASKPWPSGASLGALGPLVPEAGLSSTTGQLGFLGPGHPGLAPTPVRPPFRGAPSSFPCAPSSFPPGPAGVTCTFEGLLPSPARRLASAPAPPVAWTPTPPRRRALPCPRF